jgi:predicted acyl esterase
MSAAFTTAPLSEDKVVLGSASLDLHLSSTGPDTDLEVTLSEVRPDGKEVFVQQGWLRASHRALDDTLSTATRPFQTHEAADTRRWSPVCRPRCASRSSPSVTSSGGLEGPHQRRAPPRAA